MKSNLIFWGVIVLLVLPMVVIVRIAEARKQREFEAFTKTLAMEVEYYPVGIRNAYDDKKMVNGEVVTFARGTEYGEAVYRFYNRDKETVTITMPPERVRQCYEACKAGWICEGSMMERFGKWQRINVKSGECYTSERLPYRYVMMPHVPSPYKRGFIEEFTIKTNRGEVVLDAVDVTKYEGDLNLKIEYAKEVEKEKTRRNSEFFSDF